MRTGKTKPETMPETLRDYFAAHAPAEYLAAMAREFQDVHGDDKEDVAKIMANAAFLYADAMIEARKWQA